jgi:hypothetical protein
VVFILGPLFTELEKNVKKFKYFDYYNKVKFLTGPTKNENKH